MTCSGYERLEKIDDEGKKELTCVEQTIRNFKPMASSIDTVYMVEASAHLRAQQHALLCGEAPLEQTDTGFKSTSKHLPNVSIVWAEDLKMLPAG